MVEGMHRTVIARFLLEAQNVVPVVYRVYKKGPQVISHLGKV